MKWPLLPLILILTACDSSAPPQPKTAPRPDTAFDTQIQAVQKAKAVEKQVTDAAATQRRQVDEATGQ